MLAAGFLSCNCSVAFIESRRRGDIVNSSAMHHPKEISKERRLMKLRIRPTNAVAILVLTLSGFVVQTAPAYMERQTVKRANSDQASTVLKSGSILTSLGPSVVSVNGRQLLVSKRNPDGTLMAASPYVIRGVVWSPVSRDTLTSPTDPKNADVRRLEYPKWSSTDIPLIRAMNANTVRVVVSPGLDGAGRAVLDQLYQNDIMAIITADDAVNDLARVQQVVSFYKDHPAVLMWMLGEEWNINRYYNKYSTVQEAAEHT
jgi:hypothetical protein